MNKKNLPQQQNEHFLLFLCTNTLSTRILMSDYHIKIQYI